jgi:hypothetical protein
MREENERKKCANHAREKKETKFVRELVSEYYSLNIYIYIYIYIFLTTATSTEQIKDDGI